MSIGTAFHQSMKLNGKGMLEASDIFVCNSSMIRKEYFYQLLCTGHYYCTYSYAVRRNSLDSFLVMFVVSGSLYVSQGDGPRLPVSAGQIAILNCYERPSYGAREKTEFYWAHFFPGTRRVTDSFRRRITLNFRVL